MGSNKKNKNSNEKEETKKYKKNKKVKTEKKKHTKLKKVIKVIAILFVLMCIIGAGIVAGIIFSDEFAISESELVIKFENSTAYDKNGNVIAKFTGDENRENVSIGNMSYLPQAFVAIEDRKFYDHHGVDLLRTAKVTIQYIINKGESTAGGGSTITQQLIKNLKEDDDDSGWAGVERKIREISRAYQVEKILSKEQILELYLNLIYLGGYGKNIHGVEMAAKYYFNKSAKDLDIAECAYIAGINHAPNAYNPFYGDENADKIKSRTTLVLDEMKEQGKINEEEYNQAKQKVENGLPFQEGTITNNSDYSYLVAAARKQVVNDLIEKKGWSEEMAQLQVSSGGLKIYTTQDTDIQTRMEEEYALDKYIINGREKNDDGTLKNEGHTQSAMVIIDHTNGQVVGIMGGLGTDSNAIGINRATQSLIQPGSSMKPIAVVAPALEKGVVTSGTVYDDSLTDFGGGYAPHNSGSFNGLMTVSRGITLSSNVVNLKILKELGPKNSVEFLNKMGVTSVTQEAVGTDITLALGTYGVSPLEMAGAYATIANDGEYIEPTFYTKVEDASGNVILEAEQKKERVMSTENAYIMKEILKGPVRSGTATNCAISGIDVGAKTGSTDEYRDRWLCGFTPYYTATTWYGFDNPETPRGVSGNVASKIWAAIMKDIHSGLEKKTFTKPTNVVTAKICTDSGMVATESCTHTSTEYYVKGTIPDKCTGHIKQTICKESGKIANEFCTETEQVTYLAKPEKENTNLWKTNDGGKYKTPITDICDIHTKKEEENNGDNNEIIEEPTTTQNVKVPDLVGLTKNEAIAKLKASNLKYKIIEKEVTSGKDGEVLEQSHKINTEVEEGTVITITISKLKKNDEDDTKNEIQTNTVQED